MIIPPLTVIFDTELGSNDVDMPLFPEQQKTPDPFCPASMYWQANMLPLNEQISQHANTHPEHEQISQLTHIPHGPDASIIVPAPSDHNPPPPPARSDK